MAENVISTTAFQDALRGQQTATQTFVDVVKSNNDLNKQAFSVFAESTNSQAQREADLLIRKTEFNQSPVLNSLLSVIGASDPRLDRGGIQDDIVQLAIDQAAAKRQFKQVTEATKFENSAAQADLTAATAAAKTEKSLFAAGIQSAQEKRAAVGFELTQTQAKQSILKSGIELTRAQLEDKIGNVPDAGIETFMATGKLPAGFVENDRPELETRARNLQSLVNAASVAQQQAQAGKLKLDAATMSLHAKSLTPIQLAELQDQFSPTSVNPLAAQVAQTGFAVLDFGGGRMLQFDRATLQKRGLEIQDAQALQAEKAVAKTTAMVDIANTEQAFTKLARLDQLTPVDQAELASLRAVQTQVAGGQPLTEKTQKELAQKQDDANGRVAAFVKSQPKAMQSGLIELLNTGKVSAGNTLGVLDTLTNTSSAGIGTVFEGAYSELKKAKQKKIEASSNVVLDSLSSVGFPVGGKLKRDEALQAVLQDTKIMDDIRVSSSTAISNRGMALMFQQLDKEFPQLQIGAAVLSEDKSQLSSDFFLVDPKTGDVEFVVNKFVKALTPLVAAPQGIFVPAMTALFSSPTFQKQLQTIIVGKADLDTMAIIGELYGSSTNAAASFNTEVRDFLRRADTRNVDPQRAIEAQKTEEKLKTFAGSITLPGFLPPRTGN